MENNSAQYNHAEAEKKWYQFWLDNKFFHSTPDNREPFTIVIPPPNVTGILHMGHIMNNTIQDILIRRARMQGKNACWVPGTDHASIATEAKVVNKLKAEGIDKNNISRDEFMEHAWEWTHKHGGIILEQLKKLGASCDWDRTKFTLDKDLYDSVIKTFIDLHQKGKIYRGIRMVNWDPVAKTAVSDEEVNYKDEKSKLYYVKYKIAGTQEYITIATTRPETILGDTAVCVHPDDQRFKKFHGKKIIIPIVNREVPLIIDDYIDIEFGTGALKVTPAHDENDYALGQKFNLESIDIFNDDGTIKNEISHYQGIDRFEVRKLITEDLQKLGQIEKIEDYTNRVGYSQRTDVPIEPKLSMQWFLKMSEIVKPAIENVANDTIKFSPERFKNTYMHWLENVRDWNISRQLWWGQRIPAYYLPAGNEYVVAENPEKALELAIEKTGNKSLKITDLRQDEDVLDTWFSSWLWPISVFDGINNPDNPEINYYYPTNVLTTGHDIIFFWVARMIIAGYEYRNQFPFKDVYFTGMVRDKLGRKMSKQLGNSPDPLDLIADYGADSVRVGMMLCSPAGGDLLYDNNLPEQGRNFCNKIWNAYRLIDTRETDQKLEQPDYAQKAVLWMNHKINQTIETIDKQFQTYRISEALMSVYRLFREDFSSWYLEAIKPGYQQAMDQKTYNDTIEIFEKLLKMLHPFMPFISEEIWQKIAPRAQNESIMISQMPKFEEYDSEILEKFEHAKEIISNIRNIRKEKNISYKTELNLSYKDDFKSYDNTFETIIAKLGGITEINSTQTKIDSSIQFIVKKVEYFIPMEQKIDLSEELSRMETELQYAKGFLLSVMNKLSNERFVQNAPSQVLEKEYIKKADAEAKINALEEQISNIKK